MEGQLKALALIGFLLPGIRKDAKRLRREMRQLSETVDSFYSLLGPRNWVFTDDLHIDEIGRVCDTGDPAEAERRLIDYYKQPERLQSPLKRLRQFDAMRPRMELLHRAAEDYEAERYYSCVLVLLAMMDGFVNDFEKEQRRGLHARSDDEMVAWDSVAGHHLGLSHAHRSFVKQVKKTDEAPTTELHRNGIMHGMMPNFDNEVVATKAWNRLFAVADWAAACTKQAAPVAPTPSLRESIERLSDVREQQRRLDAWCPREYSVDFASSEQSDLVETCSAFLENWKKKQWGPLSGHFIELGSHFTALGTRAKTARELYQGHTLTGWSLRRVRHVAAAVAIVDAELVLSGEAKPAELRWVRTDANNKTAMEWEEGKWRLSPYGPAMLISSSDPSNL